MTKRERAWIVGWFLMNVLALLLFGFADSLILRVAGAIWLAAVVTFGSLIPLGGVLNRDR